MKVRYFDELDAVPIGCDLAVALRWQDPAYTSEWSGRAICPDVFNIRVGFPIGTSVGEANRWVDGWYRKREEQKRHSRIEEAAKRIRRERRSIVLSLIVSALLFIGISGFFFLTSLP